MFGIKEWIFVLVVVVIQILAMVMPAPSRLNNTASLTLSSITSAVQGPGGNFDLMKGFKNMFKMNNGKNQGMKEMPSMQGMNSFGGMRGIPSMGERPGLFSGNRNFQLHKSTMGFAANDKNKVPDNMEILFMPRLEICPMSKVSNISFETKALCLMAQEECSNCADGQVCCPEISLRNGNRVCNWNCERKVSPENKPGRCPGSLYSSGNSSFAIYDRQFNGGASAASHANVDYVAFNADADQPGSHTSGAVGHEGHDSASNLDRNAQASPAGFNHGSVTIDDLEFRVILNPIMHSMEQMERHLWLDGYCSFLSLHGKVAADECRHDGDCADAGICCSSPPDPNNLLAMCQLKCHNPNQ